MVEVAWIQCDGGCCNLLFLGLVVLWVLWGLGCVSVLLFHLIKKWVCLTSISNSSVSFYCLFMHLSLRSLFCSFEIILLRYGNIELESLNISTRNPPQIWATGLY